MEHKGQSLKLLVPIWQCKIAIHSGIPLYLCVCGFLQNSFYSLLSGNSLTV